MSIIIIIVSELCLCFYGNGEYTAHYSSVRLSPGCLFPLGKF